ncbi:hypothetical protein Mapa_009032 [Marchantia paleacea]|nr:hypothetical protein Mapa_009032 [Marchantia paleacea]
MVASENMLAAFLLSAFLLEISRTCAQDNRAEDHLNLMETNVKVLASKLADIFSSPCGQDSSCPNGCSQHMCEQLSKDLKISYISSSNNLYNCTEQLKEKFSTNNVCSSIQVTRSNSSITYFRADGQGPPSEVQNSTICRTQLLDGTFKSIYGDNTTYYMDYYVGLIEGSRRAFPGREEQQDSCLLYDSRKRPWYNGAITYPNHLVILVDSGRSMNSILTTIPDRGAAPTRIVVAQSFSSALLSTAYKDNYINVVSFGGAQDDNYAQSVQVGFDYENPSTHQELDNLSDKIRNLSNQTVVKNTDVISFLTGLNTTLRAFSDTTLPNYMSMNLTKNVVLLTDGGFASSEFLTNPSVSAAINELKNSSVNLFVYSDVISDGLKGLTDQLNGSYTKWTTYENPLHEMRSYFGYLAASHRKLFNDTPFWIPNYKDNYNVGDIITVSMPAFVQDKFIGVAAIDVLLDELPFGKTNINDELVKRRTSQENKLISASSSTEASSVPPVFDDYSCSRSSSMCQASPTEEFKEEEFEDRKCRNLCADKANNKIKEIIIGSLVGAIFAAAVFATGTFLFIRRRQKETIEGASSETTPEEDRVRAIQGEDRIQTRHESWAAPL